MRYLNEYGQDTSEENKACAAEDENGYYIKVGKMPQNNGKVYNPHDIMSKPGELAFFDRQSGRKYYEFVKVNPNIYENYVKFLVTRREAYRVNAERGVLYGG
jgi:hypothetical protein